MSGNLAAVLVSANAAGNGILVLAALLLFAGAMLLAAFAMPRDWRFVLCFAGLAVFMAALLVGN